MSRLKLAPLFVITSLPIPAAAQERVLVGTQRLAESGALFLAAAHGYFKVEGIDLGMTAYDSGQTVAETLAAGTTDFGLAGFTPAAGLSLSTGPDCPHQADRCRSRQREADADA